MRIPASLTVDGTITSGAISSSGVISGASLTAGSLSLTATGGSVFAYLDAPLAYEAGIEWRKATVQLFQQYVPSSDDQNLYTWAAGGKGVLSAYNRTDGMLALSYGLKIGSATVIDASRRVTASGAAVNDGGVSGDSELLSLTSSYGGGAQKAITWRDASNIVGQIDTRYDGTRLGLYFGHLYSSGYVTTDLMKLDATGLDLLAVGLRVGGVTVMDTTRGILKLQRNLTDDAARRNWMMSTEWTTTGDLAWTESATNTGDPSVLRLQLRSGGNLNLVTGGLLVGGITVLDASRNLANLGTISAGAITSTGVSTFDGLTLADNKTSYLKLGYYLGQTTAYLGPSAGATSGIAFLDNNNTIATMCLNNAGRLTLPVDGISGGLVLGTSGAVQLYRSASAVLTIVGSLTATRIAAGADVSAIAGDITANRGDNTGALFLGTSGHYLYHDNTKFYLAGGGVYFYGALEMLGTAFLDTSRNATLGTVTSSVGSGDNDLIVQSAAASGQASVWLKEGTVEGQLVTFGPSTGTGAGYAPGMLSLTSLYNNSGFIAFHTKTDGALVKRLEILNNGTVNLATGPLQMGGATTIDANRAASLLRASILANGAPQINFGNVANVQGNFTAYADGAYGMFGAEWNTSGVVTARAGAASGVAMAYNSVRTYYDGGLTPGASYTPTEITRVSDVGLDIRAGGLWVGGTRIADASRNLANLGTIASGAISATGDIYTTTKLALGGGSTVIGSLRTTGTGGTSEIPGSALWLRSDTAPSNIVIYADAQAATAGSKTVLGYYSHTLGDLSALEIAHVSSGYGVLRLLKSGGRVLVGTNTDDGSTALQVAGAVKNSGLAYLCGGNVIADAMNLVAGAGTGVIRTYDGSTGLALAISGSETSKLLALAPSGNVLIGTTTDVAGINLQVNGPIAESGVTLSERYQRTGSVGLTYDVYDGADDPISFDSTTTLLKISVEDALSSGIALTIAKLTASVEGRRLTIALSTTNNPLGYADVVFLNNSGAGPQAILTGTGSNLTVHIASPSKLSFVELVYFNNRWVITNVRQNS